MIIGSRTIGPAERPFIIAEVAQTHEGSLGAAFAFIDVSATRHFPEASAVAFCVCPANVTVTASPGDALPQIGTA